MSLKENELVTVIEKNNTGLKYITLWGETIAFGISTVKVIYPAICLVILIKMSSDKNQPKVF